MKRALLTAVSVLLALAMLGIGFLAPNYIERIMEEKSSDIVSVEAEPVSFSSNPNDRVEVLAMLTGAIDIDSTTTIDSGYAYDRKTAQDHAYELLRQFCAECGFDETVAMYDVSAISYEATATCHFYISDSLPHSTILWFVTIQFEDYGLQAAVEFEDSSGSLVGISVPLFGGELKEVEVYQEALEYYTDSVCTVYAEMAGVSLGYGYDTNEEDPEEVNKMAEAENGTIAVRDDRDDHGYTFGFFVRSEYGKEANLKGYWDWNTHWKEYLLHLTIMPGG